MKLKLMLLVATSMLGCKVKVDGIKLLLENNSDIRNPITVLIYLDNMPQDSIVVQRNSDVVKYKEFFLNFLGKFWK